MLSINKLAIKSLLSMSLDREKLLCLLMIQAWIIDIKNIGYLYFWYYVHFKRIPKLHTGAHRTSIWLPCHGRPCHWAAVAPSPASPQTQPVSLRRGLTRWRHRHSVRPMLHQPISTHVKSRPQKSCCLLFTWISLTCIWLVCNWIKTYSYHVGYKKCQI